MFGHESVCTIIFYAQSDIYILWFITNLPLTRYECSLLHKSYSTQSNSYIHHTTKHPLTKHNSRFVIVISRFVFNIYHNMDWLSVHDLCSNAALCGIIAKSCQENSTESEYDQVISHWLGHGGALVSLGWVYVWCHITYISLY